MKLKYFTIHTAAIAMMSVIMTACLGSDNEEIVLTHDAAITAFSLGTLNQYTHYTSSAGTDSVVKSTVNGSSYKFYIDQVSHEIYNTDSLPYGTDVAHVICNVSSMNYATIAIKNIASDTLKYYSNKDSIDFTQPRTFVAYSNSGTESAKYKVTVNVHQQQPDVFNWTLLGEGLADLTHADGDIRMRAVATPDSFVALYSDNTATHSAIYTMADGLLSSYINDNRQDTPMEANAYRSLTITAGQPPVTIHQQHLYTIDLNTTAGPFWQDYNNYGDLTDISQLVGYHTNRLYALTNDGKMKSAVFDASSSQYVWHDEKIEEANADAFPNDDLHLVALPAKGNDNIHTLVLIGHNTHINTTNNITIWVKTEDNTDYAEETEWFLYKPTSDNRHTLPALTSLQAIAYDGNIIVCGTTDDGQLSPLYISRDKGLTWEESTLFSLPADFAPDGSAYAMAVDSDNYIWLADGKNGKLWRGRLNRLGWATPETAITK